MYDIYPSGFVMRYNLGVAQPGYYYLWYYADTPGRHIDLFGIGSGYSNKVIVDVYTAYTISVATQVTPKPVPPDPQKECEKRGFPWMWEDGQCKMKIDQPSYYPLAKMGRGNFRRGSLEGNMAQNLFLPEYFGETWASWV